MGPFPNEQTLQNLVRKELKQMTAKATEASIYFLQSPKVSPSVLGRPSYAEI
jgi:hypothetical protein